MTPTGRRMPIAWASSAVSARPSKPSHGRTSGRPSMADSTIALTMLLGTANPIPSDPPLFEKIAVLMPTSRPSMATSAPPELPGLIAASVWMNER
jgi:hypothetical protein